MPLTLWWSAGSTTGAVRFSQLNAGGRLRVCHSLRRSRFHFDVSISIPPPPPSPQIQSDPPPRVHVYHGAEKVTDMASLAADFDYGT